MAWKSSKTPALEDRLPEKAQVDNLEHKFGSVMQSYVQLTE